MNLDKNLKFLLDQKGISISELARKTSVPVQTIHNWSSGAEPRSIRQLKVITNHFEVSIDSICFGNNYELSADPKKN